MSGSQFDLFGCKNSFLGRLPSNSVHLSRDSDVELIQQDLHDVRMDLEIDLIVEKVI